MSNFIANLSRLIRGLVSLILLGIVTVGGWLGYQTYQERFLLDERVKQQAAELAEKSQHIERLNLDVAVKNKKIEQLNLALRLLKIDHRVAEIKVLDQWDSDTLKKKLTKFQFVDVDDEGRPLDAPKVFTIDGEIVHIDAWVVKYLDNLVEVGDPLRGTSVCLFRRVYGEHQEPANGFPLDTVGSRPTVYALGGPMPEFEREIWANFWDYANNPAKAKKAGIREAQGEAPYIKLEKNKLYKIQLRASGGLSIVPQDVPAENPRPL